ncbi:MAG: NfeD family protein [Dermatophilaceae bacterium]
MDWLQDNAWAAWLGLALVLGVVEAATVDFIFLMLAGGALAGVAASALGAPFPVQVITAAIASVAFLVVVRPIAKRRLDDSTRSRSLLVGPQAYIGREAQVLHEVTRIDGRVRIAGEDWSARLVDGALPVAVGDHVEVVAIEGATVVVAPHRAVQDGPAPRTE